MERKSLGELFSFDITPYASPVRYPSGAVIFPEWQKATQLLYLEEGKARCTMSHENGAVTILDFVSGRNGTFGCAEGNQRRHRQNGLCRLDDSPGGMPGGDAERPCFSPAALYFFQ